MSRFRISAAAKSDIAEIRHYVAERRPSAAERLVAKFFRTFHLLGANPEMGQRRPDLAGGDLRCTSVGNYAIFYRIDEGKVEIARVLHGARDIEELLRE